MLDPRDLVKFLRRNRDWKAPSLAYTPEESNVRLSLLVMSRGGVATSELPASGEVVIGRGDECGVRLDDSMVSRKHALLRLDEGIELVDLGSRNGTLVGDRRLAPHERVTLAVGDMFSIGAAVLVVQRAHSSAPPIRVFTRTAFLANVEQIRAHAQSRAENGEEPRWAYVAIRLAAERLVDAAQSTVGRTGFSEQIARAELLERTLAESLRAADVVSSHTPGLYEIALADTPADLAEGIALRLRTKLRERGFPADVGAACAPRDGEDLTELEAVVRAQIDDASDVGRETTPTSSQLDVGAMRRLGPLVERVASGTINVLILGETGVGKEVMARTLHDRSPRAGQPLMCINCAALSESLLESELFGHERGAFTGAVQAKPGLLEAANGGTVFLDEIGEMPLSLQAKLLRVLEQREVQRVGSLKPRPLDVRFIAATNRDLEKEIAAGRFRQDLYFRLDGVAITIPPLRDRTDEIEALALAFVEQACAVGRRASVPTVAPAVLALLKRYAWPGNIRELRNVMERAVLLCEGGVITLDHLPLAKMGPVQPVRATTASPHLPGAASGPTDATALGPGAAASSGGAPAPSSAPKPTQPPDGDDERERIIRALEQCAGNQTHAAKVLGISRRTLVTRLAEYAIPRPRSKREP